MVGWSTGTSNDQIYRFLAINGATEANLTEDAGNMFQYFTKSTKPRHFFVEGGLVLTAFCRRALAVQFEVGEERKKEVNYTLEHLEGQDEVSSATCAFQMAINCWIWGIIFIAYFRCGRKMA